jgi:hypothetical protein
MREEGGSLRCDTCGKGYESLIHLTKHVKRQGIKNYVCLFPSYGVHQNQSINLTYRRSGVPERGQCEY